MKTAVSIQNVWVKYDHNVVLEDIGMDIEKKEIISIVGPNGSGKSTLLKAIMGFKKPFKGKIRVLGKSPKEIQKSGQIGYLPQNNSYDTNFPIKVFDVVAMTRYSQKFFWEKLNKQDKKTIHDSLKKVEISDLAEQHFGSLSGGQRQRVLIARALAIEPKILILDEPSTGLDAVAQDNFYQLLVKLRDEENLTIILVSHDIGSVSMVVDRVACLKRKLHFHGKIDSCLSSDMLQKVFGKDIHFLHHDKNCETCRRKK